MVGAQFSPARGDTAPLPRIPAAAPNRRGYLFKGLGLVAVAVVSGLIWWLIRHEPAAPAPVAQGPAKTFAFTIAEGPVATTDCPGKSTDDIKKFFGTHPCQQLGRALFTTTAGGARALVSVAVVTMPDADQAQQLKTLVDTDGTGNVTDLVRDGTAKISGAPKLSSGKYASRLSATKVVIVLADFFDGHKDDTQLARLSSEALDLAPQVTR
ncbi:hypothetical protein ORV05_22310 [Amycolatopsis cynarae]|uniref:Uncharacterized protein n=1 Tax=Amycolatopsis cynarae TaxID=2995223 RepID=A0ABY7AUX5_9PSEU|nr:hypothetical protein [Amycolatopsis sp. HUAS 11-8]WAL63726.1 hypothetical protein ORV05_22310 [Amycolatopsis sp. HUAS 11-8]